MITFTIYGEPASKANSRRIVWHRGRVMSIKSEKALNYAKRWESQCPRLAHPYTGPVGIEITIYYASKRPDLDPSLILDLMEDNIYVNDRSIHEMILHKKYDKENPRAEIRVWELEDSGSLTREDSLSTGEVASVGGTDEPAQDPRVSVMEARRRKGRHGRRVPKGQEEA